VPDRHPQSLRCISLVPTEQARPHSSLGYMVRQVMARWDDGGGSWHVGLQGDADGLDVQGFVEACERATRQGAAVLLLATTVALALLLQRLPADWQVQLPPGSRLMDTGGPKGRTLETSRAHQHRLLVDKLGLHPAWMVGELGMTELGSQRYETSLRDAWLQGGAAPVANAPRSAWDEQARERYVAPPWLRSRLLAVPGQSAPGNQAQGLVGHVDLANLDALAFIQTADLGHLDRDGGLHLVGRLPRAEWRGCGLDAEEIAAAPRR
jgi:hypothetical protein